MKIKDLQGFPEKKEVPLTCTSKHLAEFIITFREELISELDRRYEEEGYNPHITREVIQNKFNEL